MSAKKNVELLLNETVENLGIVGDVVKVKPGYARNYLLPLQIAEVPTEEKIEALKEKRATAKAQLEALRAQRVETTSKLEGISLKLTRSCNDQGVLYGSVTQRDISDALAEGDLMVEERAIRLNQPIRRVGSYTTLIQFEKELRVEIAIEILPDRTLEELDEEDMEFDEDGELIEKTAKAPAATEESAAPEASDTEDESAETDSTD
ncbi:MAG: 50S ribosomal protein L9 [Planctomycetota bacterium]|nr:50S ribosomal protein L9 [Planctomycetota bacterium]